MSCTKTRFVTEAEAEKAIDDIKNVRWRKYRREKRPIRYYLCDICHKWHLTSQEAVPQEVKLVYEEVFRMLIKNPNH